MQHYNYAANEEQDIETIIAAFLKLITESQAAFDYCTEQEELHADIVQDFLHAAELSPSFIESNLTKLHYLRQERRLIKRERENLEPFIKWIKSNPQAIAQLQSTLGKVRKQIKRHRYGQYYFKTSAFQPKNSIISQEFEQLSLFNGIGGG